MSSAELTWRRLCGLAVTLCGSQEAFRKQARILQRLVKAYGLHDVEVMVRGATQLGWNDLRGLYSKEGIGRRWAQAAWWAKENQNPHARQQVESLGALFKARGLL